VIALDQGCDWVAKTPKGRVTVPRVILAVNGHANSFGYFPKRLMHMFTYASMTRALSKDEDWVLAGEASWSMTPADPMGTTVRRVSGHGGSRIIIRNRFTYDPAMVVSDRRIAQVAKDHRRAFAARFPMLKNVCFDYSWGGRLCLSWNNVAAFGEVAPRLYSACCQNGLGTAKGTLNGMLAAELASGVTSDLLDAQLAMPQPKRVPPSPFDWIGATARLKYSEHLAGREM
jgi:glycine/D-amino acid oxidase-like deaminating enzyme